MEMTANLVVLPVFSSELVHSGLYDKVSLDLALLIEKMTRNLVNDISYLSLLIVRFPPI